jgi:hypothetical protein
MVAFAKQRKWQDKNKEHHRYSCGTQKAVAHFCETSRKNRTVCSSGVFRQELLLNLSA